MASVADRLEMLNVYSALEAFTRRAANLLTRAEIQRVENLSICGVLGGPNSLKRVSTAAAALRGRKMWAALSVKRAA